MCLKNVFHCVTHVWFFKYLTYLAIGFFSEKNAFLFINNWILGHKIDTFECNPLRLINRDLYWIKLYFFTTIDKQVLQFIYTCTCKYLMLHGMRLARRGGGVFMLERTRVPLENLCIQAGNHHLPFQIQPL